MNSEKSKKTLDQRIDKIKSELIGLEHTHIGIVKNILKFGLNLENPEKQKEA
ncbi:hypothetical protein [Neolewinella agarilytica]|uniref:Uncharacterized protein n=1 Tax=Neolewinella agarilytica TaxID=478744 RepID=A0A1H9HM63_9BACT|nr:hypothetical protein [Neolewinella agarilytica]SEQ63397.1 hypothetical protein SAMN05444359_1136 [Neolewinella agarilytica]